MEGSQPLSRTHNNDKHGNVVSHYRYLWAMSQAGGMLALFGVLSIVQFFIDTSTVAIAHNNGASWTGGYNTFPIMVRIIASCVGLLYSLLAIVVGFSMMVWNHGGIKMSLAATIITFGALFTFFAGVIAPIGFAAARYKADFSGAIQTFIPYSFLPTVRQVHAVAVFSALCATVYAATMIFALIFLQFQLWHMQRRLFSIYTASHYRWICRFYGFLKLATGIIHVALGAYCIRVWRNQFSRKRFSEPINASLFVVSYPYISIIVGCLQILLGLWIMSRRNTASTATTTTSRKSAAPFRFTAFYGVAIMGLLVELALQDLTQLSVTDLDAVVPLAAIMAMFLIAQTLFPLYLDHKANTSPDTVNNDSYLAELSDSDEHGNNHLLSTAPTGAASGGEQRKVMDVGDNNNHHYMHDKAPVAGDGHHNPAMMTPGTGAGHHHDAVV